MNTGVTSLKHVTDSLNLLQKLFTSCRRKRIQIIQNSVGGHMVMTSTSTRLISAISVSKPVNRLITTAVQGHLQHYSDGGHFVMILTCLLVVKSLELNISLSYLTDLYDRFLVEIVDFCNMSALHINIGNLKQVTSFVKSIIGSKPLCRLNDKDNDELSRLLIQVFVNNSSKESVFENLHVICCEGLPASESKLYPGLLIECHQLPIHAVTNLGNKNMVTVVMVTVSMTGDTEEISDHEYEISCQMEADDGSLDKILSFCRACKRENVDIVFCQRVIHPRVKAYLYSVNILPVERLGSSMFKLCTQLTACNPVRSLLLSTSDLGYLHSVQLREVNRRNYLYIRHDTVSSMVLANHDEESVQELKAVCCSALYSLERLLMKSEVLPGGGCWEIMTAHHLRNKVLSGLHDIAKDFGCSTRSVVAALDTCCSSLVALARTNLKDSEEGKTDNHFNHFWRVPKDKLEGDITCSCGAHSCIIPCEEQTGPSVMRMIDTSEITHLTDSLKSLDAVCISDKQDNNSESIMDPLDMCVNGVRTAFLTAKAILSTKLFVNQ